MRKIVVLINSMTDGGAEMVLSRITKEISFEKIILLENVRKFNLHDQCYESLRESYRSRRDKLISVFTDSYKLKVDNNICFSLLKRSNFINILSKFFSKHIAIISEHSVPAQDGNKFIKWINRKVINILYNRADLLIVPSQGVKEMLTEKINIKIPIKVIPNPIDSKLINEYRIEELDNQREKNIFKNQVFLCVGRFNHVKNHKNTITVFSKYLKSTHNDSHLVFLGEGEMLSECQNYTKELGINNRVHFFGFKENVYKYMSKSYAMLLNSKWESFGNVIIEAFASGCPVISTDIPVGPREIFKDELSAIKKSDWYEEYDCGLLIKVKSEKAYVDSLKIASNHINWSKKRKLAREISLKYSLDNICDQYKRVFLEYQV